MHSKHRVAAYLDVQSLIFFDLFLQVLIKNTLGLQAVLWRRVSFTLEEIGEGGLLTISLSDKHYCVTTITLRPLQKKK